MTLDHFFSHGFCLCPSQFPISLPRQSLVHRHAENLADLLLHEGLRQSPLAMLRPTVAGYRQEILRSFALAIFSSSRNHKYVQYAGFCHSQTCQVLNPSGNALIFDTSCSGQHLQSYDFGFTFLKLQQAEQAGGVLESRDHLGFDSMVRTAIMFAKYHEVLKYLE